MEELQRDTFGRSLGRDQVAMDYKLTVSSRILNSKHKSAFGAFIDTRGQQRMLDSEMKKSMLLPGPGSYTDDSRNSFSK